MQLVQHPIKRLHPKAFKIGAQNITQGGAPNPIRHRMLGRGFD